MSLADEVLAEHTKGRLECTWSPRIPSDSGAEQGGLW